MYNLLPAHSSCNRSKQDRTTSSVRKENGVPDRAPYSAKQKDEMRTDNTVKGAGLLGIIGGFIFGPPGAILGTLIGGALGHGEEIE